MSNLALCARVVTVVLFVLVAACVAFQSATGRIVLRGLLMHRTQARPDPVRIQLLLGTIALIMAVITQLPDMISSRRLTLSTVVWPVVLGASHALYLAEKARPRRG